MEDLESVEERKLALKEQVIALKAKEMAIMQEDIDMEILWTDTSTMTEEQRFYHAKFIEKIKAKYF